MEPVLLKADMTTLLNTAIKITKLNGLKNAFIIKCMTHNLY